MRVLRLPAGLAFDSAGNLYVADGVNNVTRKITASTGIISTYAGSVSNFSGNIGDGGPATSARLQNPAAIAFDSADNLYVADTYNYRVRKVSAATSAGLQPPDSLAVDKAGNIYVGSSNGARVSKVTAASGQLANAFDEVKAQSEEEK
jgi:trimeric autotransporter adhesin